MNIIQHWHNIYEIENFLTEEQHNALLLLCTEDGWINQNEFNVIKHIPKKYGDKVDEIYQNLLSFFENKHASDGIGTIRRLTSGQFMPDHTDEGDLKNSEPIAYGATIYLNNDFTGGELYYTRIGLKIVPKARNVVVHHAMHTHLVLPVESGNRYAISTFILGDNSTVFNKNINLMT